MWVEARSHFSGRDRSSHDNGDANPPRCVRQCSIIIYLGTWVCSAHSTLECGKVKSLLVGINMGADLPSHGAPRVKMREGVSFLSLGRTRTERAPPHPPQAPTGMIEPAPPKSSCPGLLGACRAPLAVASFAIAASSPVAARSSSCRALAYPPRSRLPLPLPLAPPPAPAALTILEPGGGRQALGVHGVDLTNVLLLGLVALELAGGE